MASARLLRRCPSAQPLCMATLADYEMTFEMLGLDSSAKCGIYPAQNSTVYGALFKIHRDDLPALDAAESKGIAYDSQWIAVSSQQEETLQALTYIPLSRNHDLAPKCWYKEHVLRGAQEFNLPDGYIKGIKAIDVWQEENAAVAVDELSIYR